MSDALDPVDSDDIDDAMPDMDPVSQVRDVPCEVLERTIRGAWGTKLPRDPAKFVLERLDDDDFAAQLREAAGNHMLERLRAEEGHLRKAADRTDAGRKDAR